MRVKLPQVFDPDVFDLGRVFGAEQVKTKEASHSPTKASGNHSATGAVAAATMRHSAALRSLDDPEGDAVSESD